jgi:hypothetical protein
MSNPQPPAASQLASVFDGAQWLDVMLRRDALPTLDARVLLHAGPPYEGTVPAPVLQSAMQAILFEGWARDADTARALIATGEVRLMPAQDHGVATPLAQVVSASMPLAVVGDASRVAFAPLIEGPPPALRFGTHDAQALVRLKAVAELGLGSVGPALRERSIALAPIVEHALKAGDECHGRTVAANGLLVDNMQWLTAEAAGALRANAGFVLPVLMAAALWRLQGPRSAIAAVGGNGLRFGFRLHGEDRWHTVLARPPRGVSLPGQEAEAALGAIGDSAVIDFCGLGGQALCFAEALRQDWKHVLPADLLSLRDAVTNVATGLVDPFRAATNSCEPLVSLAILGRSGERGLIGRGVYAPDAGLFAECGPQRT